MPPCTLGLLILRSATHRSLSLLALASFLMNPLQADSTWTPPAGGETFPDEAVTNGAYGGRYTEEELMELTNCLRACGEGPAADEIDASAANDSVHFYKINHSNGNTDVGSTANDGKSLGLSEDLSKTGATSVLLHEWGHVQDLHGGPHSGSPLGPDGQPIDSEPTPPEEEEDPCNHMEESLAGLELACRLRCEAMNNPGSGVNWESEDDERLDVAGDRFKQLSLDCDIQNMPPELLYLYSLGHAGGDDLGTDPPCDSETPCGPNDGC